MKQHVPHQPVKKAALSLSSTQLSIVLWCAVSLVWYSLTLLTTTVWNESSSRFALFVSPLSGDKPSPWVDKYRGGNALLASRKIVAKKQPTIAIVGDDTTNTFSTTVPSRVWNRFQGGFPCFYGQTKLMIQEPAHKGFLFQRPKKVGSTSMVSVVLRLAHNQSPWRMAKQTAITSGGNTTATTKIATKVTQIKCLHRSMHGNALGLEYDRRIRSKSFLFSLLRHPTQRVISEFFHFLVSVHQEDPTDANFQEYLKMPKHEHNYLNDLTVTKYIPDEDEAIQSFVQLYNFTDEGQLKKILSKKKTKKETPFRLKIRRLFTQHMKFGTTPLAQVVQDILDGYDFIAITERMDESLVVMQMLLNLTTKDILYTRARSSGSFSNGPPERPCLYIQPSFLTPGMKEFLNSPEWQDTIRGDMLLYQGVHRSLDRTIEALGKEEFHRNLKALQAGLQLAQDHCMGRVRTACTEGGDFVPVPNRTCYIWGEACDHECLNDIELP